MTRSSGLSRDSLLFLRDILLRQSLAVSAPDFTATAAIITRALAELDEAIAEVDTEFVEASKVRADGRRA